MDCVDVVVVEWEAELCLLGREGGKGRSERERGGKGRKGKGNTVFRMWEKPKRAPERIGTIEWTSFLPDQASLFMLVSFPHASAKKSRSYQNNEMGRVMLPNMAGYNRFSGATVFPNLNASTLAFWYISLSRIATTGTASKAPTINGPNAIPTLNWLKPYTFSKRRAYPT